MNKCDQVKYEFCVAVTRKQVASALHAAGGLSFNHELRLKVMVKLNEVRALMRAEWDAINATGAEAHFLQGEKI